MVLPEGVRTGTFETSGGIEGVRSCLALVVMIIPIGGEADGTDVLVQSRWGASLDDLWSELQRIYSYLSVCWSDITTTSS